MQKNNVFNHRLPDWYNSSQFVVLYTRSKACCS